MVSTKQSIFRSIIGMMINPRGTVKKAVESTKWYYALLVSGFAFAFFFMQTGMDLYRVGQKEYSFVVLLTILGLIYGGVVIPIISVVAYGFLKISKVEKEIKWAVSSFCLSYSGTLIYGALGLFFSIVFEWRTAVSFGVSGVLWAIGPLIISSREITNGNLKISIPLVTVFSTLVLLSWSLISKI